MHIISNINAYYEIATDSYRVLSVLTHNLHNISKSVRHSKYLIPCRTSEPEGDYPGGENRINLTT